MAGAAIPDIRSDPEKAMLKLQVLRPPSLHPRHASNTQQSRKPELED